MSYIVFRLTRNAFCGHYVSILWTLTKPGSDRIRSTHETLYLPLSHLVEYRGLIRSGPRIQVLFMPRLCHVLDETVCLLTCLINYFISNRQWPTIWKRSNIVLFFFKERMGDGQDLLPTSICFDCLVEIVWVDVSSNVRGLLLEALPKYIWLSEGTFVLHSASKNIWGLESISWHKRSCYSSGCWFNQGIWFRLSSTFVS